MEQINSLTPTMVLIAGTIINHVFKEDKELTIKDIMLMLSPTIPTVLPIIISIITKLCINLYEFLKTFSDGTKLDIMMECIPALWFSSNDNIIENTSPMNLLKENSISEIEIIVDAMFMQLLVYYISKKNNDASYDIDNEIHMKIQNSDELVETQIWKNIRIPHDNLYLRIDNIEITFVDNDEEIILQSYKKKVLDVAKYKNYTRLTDFIINLETKTVIKTLADSGKKYLSSDKLKFQSNSYEYKLLNCLKKTCPKLNKELFILEFMVIDYYNSRVKGGSCIANLIQSLQEKTHNINLFGTNIYSESIIPSASYGNLWGDIPSIPCFSSELSKIKSNNEISSWEVSIKTELNKCSTGVSSEKSESLTFYINKKSESKKNINTVFKEFITKIRNIKLMHKNGEKIKVFNTKIEKKEIVSVKSNPEYINYKEKKSLLDKAENEQKTNIIMELFNTPIPEEYISEKSIKSTVTTKQINEKYKSFGTTYLRKDDITNLVNILRNFKEEGKLFEEYGLPNKLGILLYGEPGTGKTTTIHAIASYLQKNIYYVNLNTVESNEELQMVFDYVLLESINGGIIVFEDIDAMTKVVHDRNKNLNHFDDKKLTLEYFLNLLQGSLTRDGTIFIATTNHIEVLDPAFYRIGRFDIKINMKKCDHYQIQTIYNKFIHKNIDRQVLNQIEQDKYTPAEIIFHLVNYVNSDKKSSEIMKNFI